MAVVYARGLGRLLRVTSSLTSIPRPGQVLNSPDAPLSATAQTNAITNSLARARVLFVAVKMRLHHRFTLLTVVTIRTR